MVPKHSSETRKPLLPKSLYRIIPSFLNKITLLFCCRHGKQWILCPSSSIVPLVVERLAYQSYSDFPPFSSVQAFFAHFGLTTPFKHHTARCRKERALISFDFASLVLGCGEAAKPVAFPFRG